MGYLTRYKISDSNR